MKQLLAFLSKYYHKYREIFWYLVVGGLTTLVDFAVYYLLSVVTDLHYLVIYAIAWLAAVIFAFFPNRNLVFQDKGSKSLLCQFLEFTASRVATFLIGEAMMYFFVSICEFPDAIMKPITAVLTVVLNYVFSKMLVFKNKNVLK